MIIFLKEFFYRGVKLKKKKVGHHYIATVLYDNRCNVVPRLNNDKIPRFRAKIIYSSTASSRNIKPYSRRARECDDITFYTLRHNDVCV